MDIVIGVMIEIRGKILMTMTNENCIMTVGPTMTIVWDRWTYYAIMSICSMVFVTHVSCLLLVFI